MSAIGAQEVIPDLLISIMPDEVSESVAINIPQDEAVLLYLVASRDIRS